MPAKQNNEDQKDPKKSFIPGVPGDTEQHLDFNGNSKDNAAGADSANQSKHHLTKEELDQRESGQSDSSSIPPPDDAPRGL